MTNLLTLAIQFEDFIKYSDCKSTGASSLDPEDKDYLMQMGRNYENPNLPNPPPFIADKKLWSEIKKNMKKYWKKYREPYAALVSAYEDAGGKFKKKK